MGVARSRYRVTPGLYGVNAPTAASPVLVTANYKLSFDAVRRHLSHTDCWLLVLDTRGVNVWCAAGKGTFSSEELLAAIKRSRLAELVDHHELIVPQLGAPGISAPLIRKKSGFNVVYGPVRAEDIALFLAKGNTADEPMRSITFSTGERLILIPVELFLLLKPLLFTTVLLLVLSAIGLDFFSLEATWLRGKIALVATLLAVGSGTVLVPILLPLLPWRQFWIKGAGIGSLAGALAWYLFADQVRVPEGFALLFWSTGVAGYLAMNFTGATPFTSPSGVEYEMRRAIPIQLFLIFLAALLWLAAPFTA